MKNKENPENSLKDSEVLFSVIYRFLLTSVYRMIKMKTPLSTHLFLILLLLQLVTAIFGSNFHYNEADEDCPNYCSRNGQCENGKKNILKSFG